jgi:N-acyl-D-amino-acid deacylase
VLFSGGAGNSGNGGVEYFSRLLEDVNSNDGRMTLATQTRPSGSLCGLAQISPVKGKQWKRIMALPTVADRVAALKDPATRALLAAEGYEKGMWYDPNHIYPLGTEASPDYSESNGVSVAEHAARLGVHPVDFVMDRLVASDGHELFNTWFFNRNVDGLAQLLPLEHVYPGLNDTGAHAGQICDADMSTHWLTYWYRTRKIASLGNAVHKLTGMPASVLGLKDRGTLAVGNFADVNVFDVDRLASDHPAYANDFPNGAGRLKIGARGYAATLVNGVIVTEQGANTGDRPGRVIREFARS